MKTVYSSVFQDDSIVVLSILNSAGIEGAMMADRMRSMNPLFPAFTKGFDIVVPDEDAEDALAIVDEYRRRTSTILP